MFFSKEQGLLNGTKLGGIYIYIYIRISNIYIYICMYICIHT